MTFRCSLIFVLFAVGGERLSADQTLYRYEADEFSPCHASHGWQCGGTCENDCSDSVEHGHFVLRFARGGSNFGYTISIATTNAPPPPPIDETFWAEFRFRSNCPAGTNWLLNDAHFTFHYNRIDRTIVMFGDATSSAGGAFPVLGLDLNEFHTYRFESVGGTEYTIAVDGWTFIESSGVAASPSGAYLSMSADGACDGDFEVVNEWDFIRYGTIDSGEQVIASDPPAGVLNSQAFPGLDCFTVTFDSANFVYINDVTIDVSGGASVLPNVIRTGRRENDGPDTVEIVLDRPMPIDRTTTFTINTGLTTDCETDPPVNCVKYTLADLGPVAACGDGTVNQATEECDGSDDTACPGTCRDNCICGFCGDGIVDPTEQCDSGLSNSDMLPDTCRRNCALPTCGDNVTDTGEECDGTSDDACPGDPETPGGLCLPDCTCDIPGIPTLSHWGLLALAILLLALRRRAGTT